MTSSLNSAAHHIRQQLALHPERPLTVGLQGPQGSGKSFISSLLQKELSRSPTSLRVVVLSIDDLYLPHPGLAALAESHSDNALLKGRGQPGTHDVQLGLNLLSALREGKTEVELPSFDKSLFNGEGDRLPVGDSRNVSVLPPRVDVIIVEGWCVGFQPISFETLEEKWAGVWKRERELLQISEDLCTKSNIIELNRNLVEYQTLWEIFDVSIQLKPFAPIGSDASQYSIIYKWRLEQEHYMKSLNGNRGMSDEAVKKFVDRYIPGYVFFLKNSLENEGSWKGRHLVLTLDENREVIETAS